jgi:hypothetical protein
MVSPRPKSSKDSLLQLVAQDVPSKANQYTPIPNTPAANEPDTDPQTGLGSTLSLAAKDVRRVLEAQHEQGVTLTTKLNILFVSNGALLTNISIARLMIFDGWYNLIFKCLEILGFLVSFTLLILAFFPRQVVITPNLEDRKFLERYLPLSAEEYQLQMLVNLVETYIANKQRLDDVSQSLRYAAYATWAIAAVMLFHMVIAYSLT